MTMTPFAKVQDAIPLVPTTAYRNTFYPSTTSINQRVQNLETGDIERWDGSAWQVDFEGAAASANPIHTGSVTPNGAVVGSPGWLYLQAVGTTGAMLWQKQTGTATNTGWAALHGTGTGSPEGVFTATVGADFSQSDGTNGTALWVKRSGTGNTGWAQVATTLNIFNVKDYGAKGDGVTDDKAAIQATIDAVDAGATGGVVVFPPATYAITDRVELRADNLVMEMGGATILGPTISGFAGDLFCIVDSRTPTRIVQHVRVTGGLWKPRAATDNGLTATSAQGFIFEDITGIMPAGTSSALISAEAATASVSITRGLIRNIRCSGGGEAAVQLTNQLAVNTLTDIVVDGVIVSGADKGVEINGDADARPAQRITVQNVVAVNCNVIARLSRMTDSRAANLVGTGLNWGLWIYQPNNLTVAGVVARTQTVPVAPTGFPYGEIIGILVQAGTGTNGPYQITDVQMFGAVQRGIQPETDDGVFTAIHVDGAGIAFNNSAGKRTIWQGCTYANITSTVVQTPGSTTDIWGQLVGDGTTLAGIGLLHQFYGALAPAKGLSLVPTDHTNTSATLTWLSSGPVHTWSTNFTGAPTVTLTTTGAVAGAQFLIVRYASATGAFSLNVGTGPLAALGIGEWCLVGYDGAAWQLLERGLLGAVAPLASPTFTGAPTVPTAAANTNSTQAASTAYVDRAPGSATATSAAPAGTTSTTAVMMATGGTLTPARSTRALLIISGQMANATINDGATVQLRYGTGTAPINGAAVTGTQAGASQTSTSLVAASKSGFSIAAVVTGLTIGTAYWVDVALNAVTGGTATVTGVTVTTEEI